MAQRENIGAILVREGLVTDDDLQVARGIQAESGEALTRVLVDESMIDEAKLVRVLAEHMGIEYVNLADVTVDPTAALLIPETLARRYSVIPYGFDGDALLIAMADPSNVLVIDDIRAITGMQVVSRISTRSDILDAVRHMGAYDDSVSDLADLMNDDEESEDLSGIELFTRARDIALPRSAAIEVHLDIVDRQIEAWRAAVDHHTDSVAV